VLKTRRRANHESHSFFPGQKMAVYGWTLGNS
jgi:hypothetical protein